MSFDFISHRENENIIPTSIQDKEKYYFDLMNIQHSFTGRLDVMFSNDFFREASQLIINAIKLYEDGYFDCAFYSIRQSLEISTTIVYFVDDDEESRKRELRKWRNEERFPQQGQMLNQLQNRKKEFSNIKEKMSLYFEEVELIKNKLNKYVHKQGFDKFYIHRKYPFKKNFDETKMLKDFESSLIKSIGAIAVFRLAIDPMPLLLNDESIYKRTIQLMTESYSDDFLGKYIGHIHINAYKETELYKSHYEHFIQNEEMSPAVTDLVKNDFVDRNKIDEIMKQKHLLNAYELVALALFSFSRKISKIYCIGGFHFYFSDTESTRSKLGWSSNDFKVFENDEQKFNKKYDEAFLSYFSKWDEDYYIEHIMEFSENEINILKEISTTPNTRYNGFGQ
ncbi:hypothetical protein RRM46_002331 [Flavobacterium psychrophilum]|nr:hypothetical protein [Flavobacterium psychrophilum]